MLSFKEYITESVKTYQYTIKIAGDVDKNFLDLFKYNLNKFDPIEISDPITTPIQKSPYGFPNLSNQSITIIKANFRYPATEPMIQQMAQLLGYNLNMVRVIDSKYDDSIDGEAEQYANQMKDSPVLTHEEMPDNGKEAGKEYAGSYLNNIRDRQGNKEKGSEMNIPYAGEKTKSSFDPFKAIPQDPKGAKSPMSAITRPQKPKTGSGA